ncbi:MAG: hypothetical protein ACRDNS_18420 [Trebonia sp.]
MDRGSGALGCLNDVSIKTKLSACFGLLVLGLVVAVVVASSGMSSMKSAHSNMVTVGVPKQLEALRARGAAADMHFSQTMHVLDGGAIRSDFLGDKATYHASLTKLLKLSTDASDKPLAAAIESATAAFDRGDAKLWSLVSRGRLGGGGEARPRSENDAADALMAAFVPLLRSGPSRA